MDDLELNIVLGLDNGLNTLKLPLTYLSYGMICLSNPWNLSCTVNIWFNIGEFAGINE